MYLTASTRRKKTLTSNREIACSVIPSDPVSRNPVTWVENSDLTPCRNDKGRLSADIDYNCIAATKSLYSSKEFFPHFGRIK